MKIILHGATNGCNFGDFLFANMFYENLRKQNYDVIFFEFPKIGISKFFKKFLNYQRKQHLSDLLTADILIYISGGYFGETNSGLKDSIKRFIRYIPLGMLFIMKKKPIMIVGVGGSPVSNKFLRNKFIKLLNYSSLNIFRDEVSANYYRENGVTSEIIVTADTALSIKNNIKCKISCDLENEINFFNCKKKIFLHVSGEPNIDKLILDKVVPSLNIFLEKNTDYMVIVGKDNIENNDYTRNIMEKITVNRKIRYEYSNPLELYSLLDRVDIIMTSKLHVGIIGTSFSKSVISFPYHPYKTKRFYEAIGESDRCIPIYELNNNDVYVMLNKYQNNPIILDKKFIELSKQNLKIMNNKIVEVTNYKK